ncbi:MAG: amidohydrolase family protein [Proteobacteria bacterium]|nr:amidohydrolase family protein [Pseudomonadota bacterium]
MKITPKTVVTNRISGDCQTGARTKVSIRQHQLLIDEPIERGGTDLGPTPVETMLSALLACTNRITTMEKTPYCDVTPYAKALIEANEDRVIWGTDWPHPALKGNMPNDGALLDQLADWAPDEAVRKKILVENSEELYGF